MPLGILMQKDIPYLANDRRDDEPVLTETGEGARRSQPPHAEPNTQKSAWTANPI
jgi:hypothetical protein